MAFWCDAPDQPHSDQHHPGQHHPGLPRTENGTPGELAIVVEPGDHIERKPVVRLPIVEVVPILAKARRAPTSTASIAFWGAATVLALQLVARGKLLPGLSANDVDSWHAGPFTTDDLTRIEQLAAAMPAEARAIPLSETAPYALPHAGELLRAFLDAVADGLPRGSAATAAAGTSLFAGTSVRQRPQLRNWARETAAGSDAGIRISLRIELPHDPANASLRAVAQVHSLTEPTRIVDAARLWGELPAGFTERSRLDTTVAIRAAARRWPALGRLLEQAVPTELIIADDEITELLAGAGARLAEAGIDVHWPTELARDLSARAMIEQAEQAPSDLPGVFGGTEPFAVNWQLALGENPLTTAELDQLAEAHRPVVWLRDRWTLVAPNLADKARERELKSLTPIAALSAALSGTTEVDGERVAAVSSGWLEELRERLQRGEGDASRIGQPRELAATLRDYQLRGLRWLAMLTELGLGGCLADDMGLGKTVTLIGLHLHRRAEGIAHGPTLVVCPASLLGNWEREIARFAPSTQVRRFHGTARHLAEINDGFVLTTYATMRLDAAELGAVPWDLLVADEAQHVKNPYSGTARALRTIPATARIALTGTPVENNLSDLWAILDWTTPGLLGTLAAFRTRWAQPVEADNDRQTAERLAKLTRPFLLRRRKTDPGIAPELPTKTETDQPVTLSTEQAGLYEAAVRETMSQIRGSAGMARRGLVVKLLTSLKQICNHPAQYLAEESPRLSGRSGKLDLLDELVEVITAENGSMLVFTQYVAMARLLERHLTDRGIPSQLLHGGTPTARRQQLVDDFQAGRVPVFLLSLKAAGVGLNLTRAEHVVHYDRWWNPAVEDQATDRAYRIGQTRPVQVHRLIAEGTIEDRVATMLAAKRDLADAVLTSGEAALTELSDSDLAELVELRRGR